MEEFAEFIEVRYAEACGLQNDLRTRHDAPMMLALGNDTATAADVVSWMQAYNLFQGRTTAERRLVAERFLGFRQAPRPPWFNQPAQAQAVFAGLHLTLAPHGERKWLSAASKLLWCLYPKRVPMYDTYVHRSLVVLGHLHPVLADLPGLGNAPEPIDGETGLEAAARYANFYSQYYKMVHALRADNAALLTQLRAQHRELYPYDIRILDKLLWMMGKG